MNWQSGQKTIDTKPPRESLKAVSRHPPNVESLYVCPHSHFIFRVLPFSLTYTFVWFELSSQAGSTIEMNLEQIDILGPVSFRDKLHSSAEVRASNSECNALRDLFRRTGIVETIPLDTLIA